MKGIEIFSFGFDYAMGTNSEFVFDVRRIRDPRKVPSLVDKTGEHPNVRGHVMADQLTHDTILAIEIAVKGLLPGTKGNNGIVAVGIGSSEGRHRSVVVAEELAVRLKSLHVPINVLHREKAMSRW